MSNRLQEIKNEVAEKHHYGYWVDLVAENDLFTIDKYFTEAINQYAKECSQASLEKASRIVKTFKSGNSGSYLDASIDKLSITQESNIVLL